MSIESYGMMCSYNDAIAWAERQPDSTVKDCAIRRMRYERDKTTPVRPKYHKGHYGKKYDTCYDVLNCRGSSESNKALEQKLNDKLADNNGNNRMSVLLKCQAKERSHKRREVSAHGSKV